MEGLSLDLNIAFAKHYSLGLSKSIKRGIQARNEKLLKEKTLASTSVITNQNLKSVYAK